MPKAIITKLPYLYRDAANYKERDFIYLAGKLTQAMARTIEDALDDEGFIPFDLKLGIPELQERMVTFPCHDDQPFHELELDDVSIVKSAPEGVTPIPVATFVSAFVARRQLGWDEEAAMTRLGIPA